MDGESDTITRAHRENASEAGDQLSSQPGTNEASFSCGSLITFGNREEETGNPRTKSLAQSGDFEMDLLNEF